MEPASNDNSARQQQLPPSAGLQPPSPQPIRKCPRCNSLNTKFCYYNNYSLTQPRHFCRACRRYWTHGGTLRNVPIGGGCRRNRRRSKAAANLLSRCQSRALPTPMSASFFGGSGGRVLFPPSYAAMQATSSAAGVNLGGRGGGQFGDQFQLPGILFPPQQNLMNPVMRPLAQNLMSANTAGGGSSSSGVESIFWNSITGVGPSFSAPNQW